MASNTKNRFASGLAAATLAVVSGWSASAQAALDIAEVPLYLTANVEPNIMFTLDDSGSMQWEIMPDRYTSFGSDGNSTYVYPFPSDMYGAGNYQNRVPTFTNNAYNALTRSPQVNFVYYNPAVTYLPWKRSDNTSYPAAPPAAAPHNPANPSLGTRNLTTENTQTASWGSCTGPGSCSRTNEERTFWPAVYFYKSSSSSSVWNWGSYDKVEIRPGRTYSGHGRSSRTDCAAGTCTYEQEIQNFANWYTYYRSRILSARAGVGRAFAEQGSTMRVGFATLNTGSESIDDVTTTKIVRGVRSFTGLDRDQFFDLLYEQDIPTSGTPLQATLAKVGDYFRRTDNKGPWGNTPGVDDSTPHLECRQSYNILMTDGYWSSGPPAIGNLDNTTGPTISRPDGTTYQYSPANPYRDTHSDTLADMAIKYWYTDLRDDLENRVPTSTADPAFWQHLVNFTVGFGVTGTLDPSSDLPGLTSGSLAWPDPSSADAHKLDDLWHAAVNSRGGYFSASDPEVFADALSDTLAAIRARVESSASSVAANSTRLDTDTLVYQARFDSTDWSGELLAFSLNPSDGTLVTPAQWDAGQLIPAAASRNIYTYKDPVAKGVAFQWANLNATQQVQLNTNNAGTVDGLGSQRVAWLRGDSANEVRNGGQFRNRLQSVLGDIVNSDPFYVGTQDFGYSILPDAEGSSYTTFRSEATYRSRPDMLYVGANDGMLHAFNATTGVEAFSYVPAAVYPELSKLTSPDYAHQYYVDGSPRVGDAYIDLGAGDAWRTLLVGSTGAGGRSVFALDVTQPSSFVASNVLWEITHPELGYSIGQPTIARLKAGDRWVAIFGNGYNSTSHKAQLFIVDLATGSVLKTIDTGVGSSGAPNGLATPVPVDVDGDRITDAVYAGDLHGNLWKFDLSGNSVSSWAIAYRSGSTPKPLFKATDASGTAQPITVRPAVGRHPEGGVMVYFGTGKYFEVSDGTVPPSPQIQSFYGVRDEGTAVTGRSSLQSQTILFEGSVTFGANSEDVRAISSNTVNYATKKGWYLDLAYSGTATAERVVSYALLRHGRVIFTTLIPSQNPCDSGGSSWLMELDAVSGGRLAYTVLDMNDDGEFDSADYVTLADGTTVPVSGNRSEEGIIRTPGIVSAGDREYKYASGSSGGVERTVEKGDPDAGRQSWRQLR